MKILYGIQGTGNGHISRARVMAHELAKVGAEVTYLFSGRPKDQYFDMEIFGNYIARPGLTFAMENGKVNFLKTVANAEMSTLLRDIDELQVHGYDLIISDYELIVSWAAKYCKLPVIGIGHQYAFDHDIPTKGFNWLTRKGMQKFAPVTTGIGLHWHHFGQQILPPIIDVSLSATTIEENKVVVYLPFENQETIAEIFSKFQEFDFYIFSNAPVDNKYSNVKSFKLSHDEFKYHLKSCKKVICNAGFELVSECLHLNKNVLVKPVIGQAEQHSNAHALELLKYGTAVTEITEQNIVDWLHSPATQLEIKFPNVAQIIVNQLVNDNINLSKLVKECWNNSPN
jgi:uncharacterized protein (TIGR00661 family)